MLNRLDGVACEVKAREVAVGVEPAHAGDFGAPMVPSTTVRDVLGKVEVEDVLVLSPIWIFRVVPVKGQGVLEYSLHPNLRM